MVSWTTTGHWEQHGPGPEREKVAARRWWLWNPHMHIPERVEDCLGHKLKDRQRNGELLGLILAYNFFFSKRSSGSHGSEGLSEQERSQHQSPRLDPVSKNLFPSTQVIESCIRAPMAEAQFTVTIRELVCQTRLYMKWLCCFLSDCTGVLWGWTLYLTG